MSKTGPQSSPDEPLPDEPAPARSETRGPERDAVFEQLERIFASGDFDASPRSRAFVRFVVEETLAGRQAGLTQANIATRVFGRREDFDPTVDPIVRIQAGRLRRSLERYYLLSGARDPIRIELPRGLYAPLIRLARPQDTLRRAGDRPRSGAADDSWPTVVITTLGAMDGDPGLTATAERFVEELAVEMGRYRDVRVAVARQPRPVAQAAIEERAFELSGLFARDAAGPRLTLRLVDSRHGNQVWADEYHDGGLDASGEAFHEIARVVAARVASEHGVVAQRLWMEQRHETSDPRTAYGAVLRSYRFFFNRDPADLAPAIESLRRAVSAQPECGLAWVQLSRLYSANHAFEVAAVETPIADALDCAQRGVLLDPTSQRAGGALAWALLLKGELAASRAEAERALALNPNSLVYLESLAWLLVLLGDDVRAPDLLRGSIARNPFHLPIAYAALWFHHFRRGEMEQAYAAALRYRDPGFFWRDVMRACCLGQLGRHEEARAEIASLLRARPDFRDRGRVLIGRMIKLPEVHERIVDGLARAGLQLS